VGMGDFLSIARCQGKVARNGHSRNSSCAGLARASILTRSKGEQCGRSVASVEAAWITGSSLDDDRRTVFASEMTSTKKAPRKTAWLLSWISWWGDGFRCTQPVLRACSL